MLALILNMNAVKIVLKYTGNILTYIIFLAFAAIIIMHRLLTKNSRVPVDYGLILVFAIFFMFAGISTIWSNAEDVAATAFKFISGIIIAYLASLMSEDSRIRAIRISLLISTLYALYLILNYDSVYRSFIRSEIYNYLVVTLPLGLGLSFALVFLTMTDTKLWMKTYLIASIIVQTFALLRFSARGNLIFPLILTAMLLIYSNRNNPKKILSSLIVIVGLVAALYFVTVRYGSDMLVYRLTMLIGNSDQETRIPLYNYYLGHIFDNADYLFGQGFGAAQKVLAKGGYIERYPHNFILELVGEMGIVGIILIIVIAVKLIKSERYYLKCISNSSNKQNNTTMFAIINAGLLFYLLTYFKSYSIYDGYQLFIFIAMIIHLPKTVFEVEENQWIVCIK